MADNPERMAQFKYSAMSNLVLQADKRFYNRRNDEPTGDPESLAGRIAIRDMGSRLRSGDRSTDTSKVRGGLNIERGVATHGADVLRREQRKRKRDDANLTTSLVDLQVEDLSYRPRTAVTKATFGLIITKVGFFLDGVTDEMKVSAADAVLETLKDEDKKDYDKIKEIESLLVAKLESKDYMELVNLSKKITDYKDSRDDDEEMRDENNDDGVDDELDNGLVVDFANQEDQEEDEDGITWNKEVVDEQDTDEEGEDDDFTGRHGAENAAAAGGARPRGFGAQDRSDDDEIFDDDNASPADQDGMEDQKIPIHEIDAYWLQRQLARAYDDVTEQAAKGDEAVQILLRESDSEVENLRDIENDLMEVFNYEQQALVTRIIDNRHRVAWVTRWRRAAGDEKAQSKIEVAMSAAGRSDILRELLNAPDTDADANASSKTTTRQGLMDLDKPKDEDVPMQDGDDAGKSDSSLLPKQLINLDNLIFTQGNHLMSNASVKLPPGSQRVRMKDYEEVHVPAPSNKRGPNEARNLPTSVLPEWARSGFGSSRELNRIQTKCFPTAFEDDGNMLVCAPTGSGKTNVAMLAMLREIGKHRDPQTGLINLDDFKIIYIAPLKALVQEQVGNFGARLAPYGITVKELTGDRQLTKQQISETQIIVTTPEKWDVITRKATDLSYTNLVRLICIDEIHLLHDDRGPVLEAIISRTIRKTEQTGLPVRLVGLSATLPNYEDVASFLRVDPRKGLFHFDSTFRPCPLKQEFVGVTDKKPIKQIKTMNDVCCKKVVDQVSAGNQMLIFVHSRKDTAKTAKYIVDKLIEDETITRIMGADVGAEEIRKEEGEKSRNPDLKALLPYGFGIHHAGMNREDRGIVEDLFSDGVIKVLVCTATLAWGVNLPAHTVVIKGTQVYSPEKGTWVELSPQDTLQMLGRAGRPQYDTFGEGIIITTAGEMQYYLSLLNQQLPIESQLMSRLVDNLNAEIVLGNVRSRDEGVDWLGYTYLFVRMLRSPGLYSVGADYENDEALEQKRIDLIHSAAVMLEKNGLCVYEKKSGRLESNAMGRIASHYYITHKSMATYNQNIRPGISSIDMFRVFAMSEEFKYVPVRQDEKIELQKLLDRTPIPIKEGIEEPQCKINVLLQAYIAGLRLDGLALMSDMVYVTQSAGRILRAIFEIALGKEYASVAKLGLSMCKMVEKRMWSTSSPLRQFPRVSRGDAPGVSMEVIGKAERVGVVWDKYFDIDPPRMGELLGLPRQGPAVCRAVERFPRLDLATEIQPITRSILRLRLEIRPNFIWCDDLHGAAEMFWIIVEDCEGEKILYQDQFVLRKEYAMTRRRDDDAGEEDSDEYGFVHTVEFTVPLTQPKPPNYFVSLVSDRWLGAETRMAVIFHHLILPGQFERPTQILKLKPSTPAELKNKAFASIYENVSRFNPIQTQVFNSLYKSNENVLLAAPTSSGKSVCIEFAILRQWNQEKPGKIVYVAPLQELVNRRYEDWKARLGDIAGEKNIVKLTHDNPTDLELIKKGDLILATPSQWDAMSRLWQRRKPIQETRLFIADDIHMVGEQFGYIYETVVTRMRSMAANYPQLGMRLVATSVSLADADTMGKWLGVDHHNNFNFAPGDRPLKLELETQSFTIPHFPSLMIAMAKPLFVKIQQQSRGQPTMVFVPNRKQCRATALDLFGVCMAAATQEQSEDVFLHADPKDLKPVLKDISEVSLAASLEHGIGYYHEGLTGFDKRAVKYLFKEGVIQVLLVSRECCWEITSKAHLVVVMNTQSYDGKEHKYIDYPITDVLQMLGRAGRLGQDNVGKGFLMLPQAKSSYYKKFLDEALPIESKLSSALNDIYTTEISSGVVSSVQEAVDWITFSFFYYRLLKNPNFYGMSSASEEDRNDFLSELVEDAIVELSELKLITRDEENDELSAEPASQIASHYSLSHRTLATFMTSLNGSSRIKQILEIMTAAEEFEDLPLRRHEDGLLRRIYERLPNKLSNLNLKRADHKAFILLQAHLGRLQLPLDLQKDQELVLSKSLNCLYACLEILSHAGHFNAMRAMSLSQLIIQAIDERDSTLKQIPHFTDDTVAACSTHKVTDIFEFMESMDPNENPNYAKLVTRMKLTQEQLADAANFTNNKYPSVEMSYKLMSATELTTSEPVVMNVVIERDVEDAEAEVNIDVHAPFFPGKRQEGWWIVVANEKQRKVLATKRTPKVGARAQVKVEFMVESPGKQELMVYLISDCYAGVDQAQPLEVDVAEGMEEDEDDEDDGDDEEDGGEE